MTREEAIKVLRETYCGNRAFCELFRVDRCRTTDCEIYHAIKALEAEPKHGRWIKITQDWVDDAEYLCSCCGRKIKASSVLNPAWAFPYCHCGAKMDEE